MSWDVMLTRSDVFAGECGGSEQTSLFDLPEVISLLKQKFAGIDCADDSWLHYEGDIFAISFNLSSRQEIMLHIHILDEPEDAVLAVISELCTLLNCRAFDTTTGEYLQF